MSPEANPSAADAFYAGRGVCVTGGAGFIGSHLVTALVQSGANVCVLDDLSHGIRENLAHIDEEFRFIQGSILDPVALTAAMDGVQTVFHLAAAASVPGSVLEPALYFEVNATGTLQVLEAARSIGVERVIFSGSSSAYGEQAPEGQACVETMPPDPRSPYAASKSAGELLLRAFSTCYELDGVSLRYFNIFGPRQRPDSPYAAVIPLFAKALLEGRRPTIFGDGSQTRDFTHVENAVHANLLAGARESRLDGRILNIACGHSATVLELLKEMAEILGKPAECTLAPPRTGEIRHSLADISAARETLGYEPVVSFREGLEKTLVHYRELFS